MIIDNRPSIAIIDRSLIDLIQNQPEQKTVGAIGREAVVESIHNYNNIGYSLNCEHNNKSGNLDPFNSIFLIWLLGIPQDDTHKVLKRGSESF
jgi:hypothetical protein